MLGGGWVGNQGLPMTLMARLPSPATRPSPGQPVNPSCIHGRTIGLFWSGLHQLDRQWRRPRLDALELQLRGLELRVLGQHSFGQHSFGQHYLGQHYSSSNCTSGPELCACMWV